MASRTALPPYSFLPHDSYYSGHHEDAAPPAAVPELRELERQIKEGLREAATAHREMPDMAEQEEARLLRLKSALNKVELARSRLFVYATLVQTQSPALLRRFNEAQEKLDKRFEAEQEQLGSTSFLSEQVPIFGFRNRQRNNNLRALLSALSYRHGTLVHFDNLIHRSKEEVLSPSRCAKIAEECGLLVPPPVQDKMPYPRFSWQANKEGK